jgi:hypothetical protein
MMYGFFPAVGLLFIAVHALAVLSGVVGIILLIGWALKHAPAHRVKLWALWLIAIGVLLGLLTTPAMFGGRGRFGGGCFGGTKGTPDQDQRGSYRQWMMGFDVDQPTVNASSASSARSAGR